MNYRFTPPERLPDVTEITHAALQLSALSEKLSLEQRTLVNHVDGRAENVAEHSCMLAIVAPAIAEQYYPHLDANLIARFATVHDVVEAYVGDTPTHDITSVGQATKELLEQQGLEKLSSDFAWLPGFSRLVNEYEEQKTAEARFVRIIDKWTPILLHFAEGGATIRSYRDFAGLQRNSDRLVALWKELYPEYTELVEVRRELIDLAGKHLLSNN